MNPGLIILTLSLIQCNITYVNGKLNYKSYLNYVNKVVGHMCIQNGWKSMEKIYLNFDESSAPISVPDLMVLKFDTDNVLSIFYKMFHILNYKYNQVLLTFVELINIVVDTCINFFNDELLENFNNCTESLAKEMENSLTMIESLYNAITFLSYIDLNVRNHKLILLDVKSVPFTLVDGIYEIKNHTYFKQHQYKISYVNLQAILDVKEFIDYISKIANNFLEKNEYIIDTNDEINLKSKLFTEYWTSHTDFTGFIRFMYHKINSFYNETIKINYEGLGFIQLINPTNIYLKPPTDKNINQEIGITALNTLLINGNWSSFSHIEIQQGDSKVSVKLVIRDLATDHNFYVKKTYFTQMIRCRFFEVLLIYNTSLSALKKICKNAKGQLGLNDYMKCATRLFQAINNTVKMFDFMMTIIEKIKLSSIWQHSRSLSDLLSTQKLIYKYVFDLKTSNVVRDCYVKKPEEYTDKLADDYIKNVEYARSSFSKLLLTKQQSNNNGCYFEDITVTKKELEIKFQNIANHINANISHDAHIRVYELISKYLYDYCENFIKTDYENTGFNKIHQNYFWQWA
ncbi:uncharacterized protein LOC126907736 isoform X1 [Daktulosphaira vitifoliae]|uniref:uncharacterized protein LOC126907736 isoform X1 n=1 Tax=Daktulosphaira vitifoliae TaxID=58002 RepID=UPI0021AAAEB5|nr:uncharacterized protein LOC126907736 isoform X1 [Daktulosphaira vitifoliae]